MTENIENMEPVYFELGDRKFKYDFYSLCTDQAELANEVGEFRLNQQDVKAETFQQLRKSRGAEWLKLIMSYLLIEIKDNKEIEFNQDTAELEIAELIAKSNYAKNYLQYKECVRNFFSCLGQPEVASQLLQNAKSKNENNMLLQSMIQVAMNNGKLL